MEYPMRHNKTGAGNWRPLILGVGVALLFNMAAYLLLAFVMAQKDMSDPVVRIAAFAILGLSAFAGGWAAAKKAGSRGLGNGVLIGVCLFVAVTVVSVILNGLSFTASSLIKAILCVLCAMAGGVFGVNAKAKRKMK